MPHKFIDIAGQRFGSWTVIERTEKKNNQNKRLWKCVCDCGAVKFLPSSILRSGGSKSCNHCKRNLAPLFLRKHSNRLYHTWSEMKRRCKAETSNSRYYKDKGVSYTSEWENFDTFAQWAINNGYAPGLEIDRIDSDGDYTPDNCRWVTHKNNSRNRKARSNNNTGVAGVYTRCRKDGTLVYRAAISVDGKKVNLGTFYTLVDAERARREAEKTYWGFNIGE